MKKTVLLATLILAAGGMLMAGIFPFACYEKDLANGFKVIAIPLPNPGLVAYYSVVRTGHRDEYEEGHTGFAHFFEHMMFQGTKKYPAAVYDKLVTEMGANANAFTGEDQTIYYMIFAKENLEKVMELESDRFQNLSYGEAKFKTEAGAIYGEYLKSKMNPWLVMEENLYFTAFDKHTYRHTTIGFEKDILAMPTMYSYSLSFFNRYYRPENVVLLIAGDIDPQAVFSLASKYYGPWARGYVAPQITAEPEQTAPRFKKVAYAAKTLPLLAVAYKSLAYRPTVKEFVASQILGEIYFGSTSEIFQRLVIQEQKVEGFYPSFAMNRDPNLNTIFAVVKKAEDVEYCRQQIAATIKKAQNEPMNEGRLQDLKQNMKYSFLMGLQSTEDVAGSLLRTIALTGGISALDEYYTTLAKITPQDIQQTARTYFTDNRKTEILVEGE